MLFRLAVLQAHDARRDDSRRRMWVALWINLAMLQVGVVGGVLTGSLAVLADAGHVLSDVGSIVLALFAAALAARPATGQMTFGYQRSEILAALVNGLLLVGVAAILVGFRVHFLRAAEEPAQENKDTVVADLMQKIAD